MKVSINVDVTKLPKDRIRERSWTDRNGESHSAKEIRLDVVPLKEPKVIKEYGVSTLMKTHFVCVAQTKEEREARADTIFVGDGVQFVNDASPSSHEPASLDDMDDDIPF